MNKNQQLWHCLKKIKKNTGFARVNNDNILVQVIMAIPIMCSCFVCFFPQSKGLWNGKKWFLMFSLICIFGANRLCTLWVFSCHCNPSGSGGGGTEEARSLCKPFMGRGRYWQGFQWSQPLEQGSVIRQLRTHRIQSRTRAAVLYKTHYI